ncbi:glutamate racemase [Polaromonas sp.]|uniref:glutamate racemase n=1 Tax=Polaromonas sp. TaxID=1869339 RepID=UPI00326309A0
MSAKRPIGVFDSGVGGLSVLQALRAELPCEDFIYIADSGHAPYGERGDAFVSARTRAIAQHLRDQHRIKALVVACNTATAAAAHLVRAEHPDLPLVGLEPALKPAVASTRTGRIGVMGTRGTVTSAKFRTLLSAYQNQSAFVVQPCDGLAHAIEQSAERPGADAMKTRALCARYTRAMGQFGTEPGEIDTLVLGCTHYFFAIPELRELLGEHVQLIATGEPVARQTRRLLSVKGELSVAGSGVTQLFTTGQPAALQAAAQRWLQLDAAAGSLHF